MFHVAGSITPRIVQAKCSSCLGSAGLSDQGGEAIRHRLTRLSAGLSDQDGEATAREARLARMVTQLRKRLERSQGEVAQLEDLLRTADAQATGAHHLEWCPCSAGPACLRDTDRVSLMTQGFWPLGAAHTCHARPAPASSHGAALKAGSCGAGRASSVDQLQAALHHAKAEQASSKSAFEEVGAACTRAPAGTTVCTMCVQKPSRQAGMPACLPWSCCRLHLCTVHAWQQLAVWLRAALEGCASSSTRLSVVRKAWPPHASCADA